MHLVKDTKNKVSGYVELPATISIAADEILRVDNDSSRPESGSIRVYVEGGK